LLDGPKATHPFIVRALASMFDVVGSGEIVAPLEDDLFELMRSMRKTPIDLLKDADVSHANVLYEALAELYRAFAKLFYPKALEIGIPEYVKLQRLQREKVVLTEMSMFALAILRIKDVNEFVLDDFCSMVWEFGKHWTRRKNVSLNNVHIHVVLDMAQDGTRTSTLRSRGKQVMKFITRI
jgi:hypothetical protein